MFREISLKEVDLVAGGSRSASSVDDDSGYYQPEMSTGAYEWNAVQRVTAAQLYDTNNDGRYDSFRFVDQSGNLMGNMINGYLPVNAGNGVQFISSDLGQGFGGGSGEIVVTASLMPLPGLANMYAPNDNSLINGNGTDDPNDLRGDDGNVSSSSILTSTEAAIEITETKLNVLKDLQAKYGANHVLNTIDADGNVIAAHKVSDLIDGLTRLTGHLGNAVTVAQIASGDKNLHDAVYYAFGLTVTAMAAEAGAGATLAGALGFGAEYASGHLLNWMEGLGQLNRELQDYINAEIAEYIRDHAPPAYVEAPVTEAGDILRGMLGVPTNPFSEPIREQ